VRATRTDGETIRRRPGTESGTIRRRLAAATCLAFLLLMLAACGSSGPATSPAPASPPAHSAASAGGYLGCLLRHEGGSPGSARQACASLRPANLAAVLLTFESCLKAHGVSVPAPPAQGRRAALLQFVAGLRAGSRAQRSALTSCIPSGISG
jgi:predicted small lipoprotein YifL